MTNPISKAPTQALLLACAIASLAFVGIPLLGSPGGTAPAQVRAGDLEGAVAPEGSPNRARTTAAYRRQSDGAEVTVSIATVQTDQETLADWAARHAKAMDEVTGAPDNEPIPTVELSGSPGRLDPESPMTWIDDEGWVTTLSIRSASGVNAETKRHAFDCFTRALPPGTTDR